MPEGYILAEDLELPLIVVNIVDYFSFEQSETVDNITITVKADKGVFPDTAKLRVKRIYNPLLLETYCEAADRADADTGNEIQLDKIDEKSYVFDILIVDDEGMELQPDNTKGTVTVEFSNPEPAKFDISDYNVYHIDEESGEAARLDTNIDNESELVAVEVDGFSPFVFRATTYVTVLFTGGGTIDDEAFTEAEKYVYASEDNIEISELPIPDFDSEDIEFDSWELGEDGAYYAKWNRVTDTVSGEYIKYNYLENGINIKGIKDEKEISTSYNNMGAMQVYLESPQPQNDSEPVEYEITNLNISSSGDIYTQINENLYVATAASIKDRFVEITYYIWNKGEEDIEDFNIGMSQDIQIGDNDKVSLALESDENGKYALMEDNGIAVKIYYQGDVVTDTTTFWTGLASKETENVFEDNPCAQTDIDSAIALSWKNIDIPAKGIVTKSYMFGCGDKQSMSPKKSVKVDTNGDKVFDTETRVKIGTSYRLPEAAKREGYRFDHYLCSGKEYNQGAVIYPREDMEFTAVFSLLESTVRIDLLNDSEPWEGQKVELYLNGELKYHMAQQADGSYVNNQVVNAHYDIYVNGKRLLEDSVNVLAPFDPIQVSTTVEFHTIKITTTLDGVESSNAGVLSLRNNGIDDVYVLSSDNGVYYGNIQVAEGTYDIYVNKEDTDFDISALENEAQIDFVTVKVNIEDDTIWNNARVEIRDADTNRTDFLEYTSYNENVATYTKIMPESERQLNIFVDDYYVHKNICATVGMNEQNLSFYTAKVEVEGNPSDSEIKMSNGIDNYNLDLIKTEGAVKTYKKEHTLLNSGDGELEYKVEVTGTVDSDSLVINSQSKELSLKYYYVIFYNVTSEYQSSLVKTVYVLEGELIPPYFGNTSLSAYTFSHWSETRWPALIGDNTYDFNTKGEKYDFSKPLTKNTVLYAVYGAPTVDIGDLVYTDTNGIAGGTGSTYKLGNLTLTGFDPGEGSVKYVFLTATNINQISILNTNGVSVKIGSSPVSTNGSRVDITPTGDRVAIEFTQNGGVSMAQAQDFLRNQIVITPVLNKDHGLIVEVTDRGARYKAATVVSPGVTSTQATQLTTTSGSKTINSGIYYITSDVSFNSGKGSTNGLVISSGATVYLYIPQGKTLTSYGKNGSGSTAGGAGIYLPSGAKLYVYGTGTLKAVGGNAGNGASGENGSAGSYSGSTVYQGKGGSGGNGGGGAGAGIGTNGGSGGSGGSGGASHRQLDIWTKSGDSICKNSLWNS